MYNILVLQLREHRKYDCPTFISTFKEHNRIYSQDLNGKEKLTETERERDRERDRERKRER